jgi:hypothetical protein
MNPTDAATLALRLFEGVQAGRQVESVLVEAIDPPKGSKREWEITIGYASARNVLGVPVAGARLRSVVRLAENGEFLGMHVRERDES